MKVKSEREVAQSCLTLHDPMDCSLPGCSIQGIFQARVLEWVPLCVKWASLMVLVVKNLPAHAGDLRDVVLIPGSGRCPRGRHGNPLSILA